VIVNRARLCSVFAVAAALFVTLASAQSVQPLAPKEHARGVEQTFLTYPEWFLVFSPDEYATFTEHGPPSEFPFWGHIREFWQAYAAVTRETSRRGERFNFGYHVMIMVIGVSTTVEYAARSVYETLVGRVAELTRGPELTQEDIYAARVAREYVDFIRVSPWYQFDFRARLVGLWKETDGFGPGLIRKWERKYALTTEYVVKAVYGGLIGKGTAAGYERPLLVTAVALDRPTNVPSAALAPAAGPLPAGLILLPRYDAFTGASLAVAREGANFREIAGNGPDADILVSVVIPTGWNTRRLETRELFRQPIITQPGTERAALVMPVGSLAENLRQLDAIHARVEHVFDY
jgi:hypothetical protein